MALSLFRQTIQRAEAGVVKILSGAVCTLYNTMTDGSAPVTTAGVVSVGAVKTTIYSDRNGTITKSNPITSDTQGIIEAFAPSGEIHILVTLTDGTVYGVPWIPHVGTSVNIDGMFYNVRDFSSVQAALNSIPENARLYFPRVVGGALPPYVPPTAAGWNIIKGVEIFSDAELVNEYLFSWYNFNNHQESCIFTILGNVGRVKFRNLIFSAGTRPASRSATYQTLGTGSAIRVIGGSTIVSNLELENVTVLYSGGNGIHLDGNPNYIVDCYMNKVTSSYNMGRGFYLGQMTGINMINCSSYENRLDGVFFENCENGNIQLEVGQNCKDSTDTDKEGQIVLKYSTDLHISGCNVETFIFDYAADPDVVLTVKNGIVLYNCRGVHIEANQFDNAFSASNVNSRAIYFYGDVSGPHAGSGNIGNFVGANDVSGVESYVKFNDAANNYGNVVIPPGLLFTDAVSTCVINIPTGSRNFALVADQPSGQYGGKGVGILLPSVPDHTTIHSSVVQEGLLVYDSTTHKLMIRINGNWEKVGLQT